MRRCEWINVGTADGGASAFVMFVPGGVMFRGYSCSNVIFIPFETATPSAQSEWEQWVETHNAEAEKYR